MTTKEINSHLANFNLSQEELDSRELLSNTLSSLASVVVDEFASSFLLNNPNLSIYLTHTDSPRLLKNIKEFIVFIFSAPVDEAYINRIHFIGSIHYSIKLEPAKVSYGFNAIKEVLNRMYDIDENLKQYRFLISKVLSFVEYHMNDAYYIERDKQKQGTNTEFSQLDIQIELFSAFEIHKKNIKKIKYAMENNNDMQALISIKDNPLECIFGKIIIKLLEEDSKYNTSDINLKEIETIHNDFHHEFSQLKDAMSKNNNKEIKKFYDKLNNTTNKLQKTLNSVLNNSFDSAHIALSSAMKAMNETTQLFYKKDYNSQKNKTSQEEVKESIDSALLSKLSWAIESIEVNLNTLENEERFDLSKIIRYNGESIYIGVILDKENKNAYIQETIRLLLEVLDLHFSVKERELSLISFADKAQSANKAKDMFLANMSHELRTPLNAIKGFSQILLSKKDTPPKSKKFIEKINIAGNHLLELVNTILDFAKLESGKMQFNPSLSDISQTLNEVKTLISPLAQEKNITFKMPNIISLNMYIDANLFKQVLLNLLSNAIKFTPQDGEVSLNITYSSKTKLYKFEVKDNGIGLSEEDIAKLFEAFSQIENSYQKDQKGTGLGLMISKTIVEELHKGKIWVESIKEEGSSFFITMPTPTIESKTFSVNEAPKDAKKVLIVEDSPSYQNILIEHLKNTHNLTLTDTVNKAKNLILNNTYDFIILDFFLIDGISSEILDFMEEEKIDVPTLVISAEDEITISSSLSGSTNLEGIINKEHIDTICASIRGEKYENEY